MTYRGVVKEMGGGLLLAANNGHCNIKNNSRTDQNHQMTKDTDPIQ